MAKRPFVALLIETSNSYARGLLRGIHAYLHEHRPWSIYLPEAGRGDIPRTWLRSWGGDGIIARIENKRIARIVRGCHVPAVDLSAGRLVPELPCVETDNREIARMAFEHFYERGFRSFAYCSDDRFTWSVDRGHWFSHFADEVECPCSVFGAGRRRRTEAYWEADDENLAAWIASLAKPCGLMACYDIRGRRVLEICRRLGVAVPDEIAVVGVDDDDLLCKLTDPPLSSVVPDTHRTGYAAAELLDAMMAGQPVEPGVRLVKPTGIVTRQSSDVLATCDAEVSSAVRFIRDHACDGIKVDDLLRAIPISRRVLESHFKKTLGWTPHEEILRVQLERVKHLLEDTDMPLTAIADRTGFKYVEYLSVVFKRHFHQTPSQYRAEHRVPSGNGMIAAQREAPVVYRATR
jgi:LacI family transcriptional regulator